MTTKNSSGGANGGASGANGGSGGANNGSENHDDDTDGDNDSSHEERVSRETYLKAVSESKNRSKRIKELEAELAKERGEKESRDRKKAEEDGDFKKLLEAERAERQKEKERIAEIESELNGYKETELARKKFRAITKAVGGAGVNPKFASLLDYSAVVVDPETGEIDSNSVSQYATALKKEYPEFLVKSTDGTGMPGGIGNGSPGTGGKKILLSEFRKLSTSEMRKYKPEDVIE